MQSILREKESVFEWIDVHTPSNEELKELATKYALPEAAVLDCMQSDHLPKFESFDNYYFVIIRFYDAECSATSQDVQSLTRKIAFFFTPNFLLTIHRRELPELSSIAEKSLRDTGVQHPFDVVCKLIKHYFSTYDIPLESMEKDIDLYESRVFLKKRTPDLLKDLYIVKRKTHILRRIQNITKTVVEQLHLSHKKNAFYEDMRDAHLHLDTRLDDLQDNIQSLLHIYLSISSQKTNEVMRILTVFSAFFLPLTFIVGVYGMNFDFMPELKHPYGYPAIMIFMAIVTIVIYRWFLLKRWL
jgi:magnesium transporter